MSADWSASGIEALHLRMVRSNEQTEQLGEEERELVETFAPTFVYPIFGEEETIFGYKGLEIDYRFTSGSLQQYLKVNYDAKFPETATVKADDPEQTLYEFIPPSYSKSLDDFEKMVEKDAVEFKPLGTRIGAYRMKDGSADGANGAAKSKSKGKGKSSGGPVLPERQWEVLEDGQGDDDEVTYEAYWSNWDTPGFKDYHRRMQIFVLLYIEGASYIDEEDGRWEFVTLFERRKKGDSISYHFAGYVSFYSFFCWPDTKRLRLAQFVLLPLYHGQGHGSALYTLCYQNVLRRDEVSELSVEDPSEAFDDMRDKCDLHTLVSANALEGVTAPLDRDKTEAIRRKYKLADRQFYRLVEMLLLLTSDPTDEAVQRAIRLTVKKRLYLFNKEQLLQIEDKDERKEKLQETFEGVRADYQRITEKFVG
ncbi:hypothetical protein JCM10213_002487 [Rhodosporidiobolus nylandii]